MSASYVRMVSGRTVQTAILRFVRPHSGRVVTLIGTFHFGSADYYAGLRDTIDKLEADGAVVHYEDSDQAPADNTQVTDQEQALLDLMHRGGDLARQRVQERGWTDQRTGLGYPEHWKCVDLPTLEIIRRLGPTRAEQIARQKLAIHNWPDTDRNGPHRMNLVLAVALRVMSRDKRIIKTASSHPDDQTIVADRDQHALSAVASTDQDLILIWGLAHLPGLEAGLTALGYRRDGAPQWHTVTIRRPTIPEALWQWATHRQLPNHRPPAP